MAVALVAPVVVVGAVAVAAARGKVMGQKDLHRSEQSLEVKRGEAEAEVPGARNPGKPLLQKHQRYQRNAMLPERRSGTETDEPVLH